MPNTSLWMRIIFGTAVFLSAFLLFFLQPMASKAMLPSFGGSHYVWNASLFFYTAILLCGYLYAHTLARLNNRRYEAIIHLVLMMAAASILTTSTGQIGSRFGIDHPILGLLSQLAHLVGLPLLLFATTSPLLQVWYARLGMNNPYPLYMVSNAGSFMALVSYPVLEYFTPLSLHFTLWKIISLIFLGCLILCLWRYLHASTSTTALEGSENTVLSTESMPWVTLRRKLTWLGFAFLPAMLLPATTTYSFKGIAPSPIFWLIPLLLYIVSFMIGFSARQYSPRWRKVLKLSLMVVILAILFREVVPTDFVLYSSLVSGPLLLLLVAILCHRRLYGLRPDTRQLTLFYLVISIGGVLGNLFVGIIAPLIFTTYLEFYIGLGLSAVTLMLLTLNTSRYPLQAVVFATQVFLLCLIPAFSDSAQGQDARNIRQIRSFYGTITLVDKPYIDQRENAVPQPTRLLMSDSILHGGQYLDSEEALIPLLYYNPEQPIAAVFEVAHQHRPSTPLTVAVAGLGSGALAAYCRPGDHFDFYEINEQMLQVAQEDFTYLDHCGDVQVILGDARLMLADEGKQTSSKYDLIVLDAFSDDAIPLHLLTLEALDIYLNRTAVDGALMFHISNRYLDLKPLIVALAKARGIEPFVLYKDYSLWVLLPLGDYWTGTQLLEDYDRSSDPVVPMTPWTDDFHSVLRLVK